MKKMSAIGSVLVLILCLAAGAAAAPKAAKSPKAVNYKVLQSILPAQDLSGSTRMKPEGSTDTAFGMSMSFASVTYEKGGDETLQTIEVRIEDNPAVMNYGGMDVSEMAATMMEGMESESDAGYFKNVTIQGFKGSERVERGESPTAEIVVLVAKRFTVKLTASGSDDAALLQKLAAKMDLAKLAKTAK